jgi:malate dehydrogenase (quinone)
MHLRKPVKDVVLIGGGIMSASLGVMLKRLAPDLEISVYEANAEPGREASNAWNNAGTGHAGICELYLTPQRGSGGEVDVSKAIAVCAQYERSLQFWAYAVREGLIDGTQDFLNPMPHMSFVRTDEQVAYLRERSARLADHHFFRSMEFTTDLDRIAGWAPLLVEGRRGVEPVAASRMETGTEVDFGSLARKLCEWLGRQPGCAVHTRHRIDALQENSGGWRVAALDLETGERSVDEAKFVFVGAGGGSLPLLQMAGIAESRGYGGFPVGGQWLVCSNPKVVAKHHAKIYGQAALGTTPAMALPHLDTRIIGGERSILFGPFAKVTTRFLDRAGSVFDLVRSIQPDNIGTLVHSGVHNLGLVKYMLCQGIQGMASRMATLRLFYPEAKADDWKLVDAGIRVQVIKKVNGRGSMIHFDTEIVSNRERTISALLGASPGASISADLMFGVIRRCLPHLLESGEARARMEEMLPGHELDLAKPENSGFYRRIAAETTRALGLSKMTSGGQPPMKQNLPSLIT